MGQRHGKPVLHRWRHVTAAGDPEAEFERQLAREGSLDPQPDAVHRAAADGSRSRGSRRFPRAAADRPTAAPQGPGRERGPGPPPRPASPRHSPSDPTHSAGRPQGMTTPGSAPSPSN
ncbi:hypothetical protein FNV65_06885 [Streptomyces sp. S1A1-8]|nr:hypothetical protein FNV67_07725 [Streptomyces sp. S1D4-20]QDN65426.1 hypothetical protein FNV66_07325 [Streptomyces sp. S1D4-14]QDN96066.1 hypothetical protein FNV58_08440 [Streptomyces sp. RLB1-9]QDO17770.1 hypothetical protein FNV65_06885 [Streptomyces sp. S1A1-8]QDO27897.1 hypothetical protein FNV63_06895 [Streptomyces sp. S1A1-3]QDO47833.1 hypothetical protein FNV60_05565 [Streptomyces sp. RLB3-5]QDO58072.1 hypothetical protein FNV59_07805 [Streptomyces sp. RLB1-8]